MDARGEGNILYSQTYTREVSMGLEPQWSSSLKLHGNEVEASKVKQRKQNRVLITLFQS